MRTGETAFLQTAGEMHARISAHGWEETALGPPARWSQALRTVVGIVLGSHEPTFAVWGDRRLLLYNDGMARVLGPPHAEALGRPLEQAWPELELRLRPALDEAFAGGAAAPVECSLRPTAPTGELCLRVGFAPIRDEGGVVAGVLCPCSDLSERVSAERALREERRRLETALEVVGAAVYAHTVPLDDFDYHGERWAEILGYRREDLPPHDRLLRWLYEQVHPDDRPPLERAYRDVVDGRTDQYSVELRLRHETGDWVWLQALTRAVERQDDGRARKLVGVLFDVSSRKHAEERRSRAEDAVRDRDAQLRRLVDGAPIGVITGELDEIADANDVFLEMVDRTRRELEKGGLNWRSMTPPEHRQKDDAALRQIREDGVFQPFEKEYERPDGTRVPVLLGGTLLKPDPLTWACFVVDMSERKRAEEALREKTAQLEEEDRRKDLFLATLGHELRNPIAALSLGMRALRERSGSRERLEHLLEREIQSLETVVNDLLEVSRIARGKLELRKAPVDLALTVRAAVDAARATAQANHQELEAELPDALVVEGDETRLAQVAANLLANAVQYTPERGAIRVVLRAEGDEAVLSVSDTGRGIHADDLRSIFEPFTQGDPTGGGLGIGLPLARGLAQLHGGSLTAESAGPGAGSTFRVRIPRGDVRGAASGPLAEPEPLPEELRVVVVDDQRDQADLLALLLGDRGCRATPLYSGEELLRRVGELAPHVLLLDLGLPGMTGYEVAERIRGDGLAEGALLVAVTGFGDRRSEERTRAAGFERRLVKPVDFDVLHGLLLDRVRRGL